MREVRPSTCAGFAFYLNEQCACPVPWWMALRKLRAGAPFRPAKQAYRWCGGAACVATLRNRRSARRARASLTSGDGPRSPQHRGCGGVIGLRVWRGRVVLRLVHPGRAICARCGRISAVLLALKRQPCTLEGRFLERVLSALPSGRYVAAIAVAPWWVSALAAWAQFVLRPWRARVAQREPWPHAIRHRQREKAPSPRVACFELRCRVGVDTILGARLAEAILGLRSSHDDFSFFNLLPAASLASLHSS